MAQLFQALVFALALGLQVVYGSEENALREKEIEGESHAIFKRDLYSPSSYGYYGTPTVPPMMPLPYSVVGAKPSYMGSPSSPQYGSYSYPSSYNQNTEYYNNYVDPCPYSNRSCTKDDHATGCQVQECKAVDTYLVDYTCHCNNNFAPSGCVNWKDPSLPLCDYYCFVGTSCTCDGPRFSPRTCRLRDCRFGEQTTPETRCICGTTEGTKPCGCVTVPSAALSSAQSLVNSEAVEIEKEALLTLLAQEEFDILQN